MNAPARCAAPTPPNRIGVIQPPFYPTLSVSVRESLPYLSLKPHHPSISLSLFICARKQAIIHLHLKIARSTLSKSRIVIPTYSDIQTDVTDCVLRRVLRQTSSFVANLVPVLEFRLIGAQAHLHNGWLE